MCFALAYFFFFLVYTHGFYTYSWLHTYVHACWYTCMGMLKNMPTACIALRRKHFKKYFWSTRPTTVPAGSDHYIVRTIFTQVVRPSVPKLQNQAKFTGGRDRGLAEWIIDDSCLVSVSFWSLFDAKYLLKPHALK